MIADKEHLEYGEDCYEAGKVEEKIAIARAMLADGLPLKKIVQYTGLSQTEVEQLQ